MRHVRVINGIPHRLGNPETGVGNPPGSKTPTLSHNPTNLRTWREPGTRFPAPSASLARSWRVKDPLSRTIQPIYAPGAGISAPFTHQVRAWLANPRTNRRFQAPSASLGRKLARIRNFHAPGASLARKSSHQPTISRTKCESGTQTRTYPPLSRTKCEPGSQILAPTDDFPHQVRVWHANSHVSAIFTHQVRVLHSNSHV